MSRIVRDSSHNGSTSTANSSPASNKKRLNFFSKKSSFSTSRDDQAPSSDKFYEPPPSDKIPISHHLKLPELELSRSTSLPSPDSFIGASLDSEFVYLRECITKIKKAPSGTDPKKVDAVWEVYKKVREEALLLCKSLLQKSQQNGRSSSLESVPTDTRSSNTESIIETSLPFHVNDQWLAAITEYKNLQTSMLENLRASLLATYKAYEPSAIISQLDVFLLDKTLRKALISKWREESVHRMKSEKLLFWEQYKIRSLNYDRLKLDLIELEKLFGERREGETLNVPARDYIVAKNGDTILEFANTTSEAPLQPVLRFRVSSHLLAETSPLFAQFLSPQKPDPPDMLDQLPPPPSRYTCKDRTEVKLYRMPQSELNKDEAFTILLYAAHMQHSKVPRQIEFSVFVSIADVCLRYRCTSPLELQVEYQWLPQWIHMIQDDSIDGFLLISYAFGLRRIFTRMSKSAILNATDEDEIQGKILWPQAVRDRIRVTRAAKIAQVNECCTRAINEFFRPPSESFDRRTSIGSLQLSSVPRCPKNSHLCDATNLGWLMLVYNELRLLPGIFKDEGSRQPSPKRSLKELIDCLRLMPSAPQVHPGMCDYAAAFRSDINDISNSVAGLTLRDVSGKNGWALSKHAGPTEDRYSDYARDLVELEAPLEYTDRAALVMSSEAISLRILSHIDDLDDLNSAAMIDKTFYQAYKQNEAMLLKSIMRAERRRTISQVTDSHSARATVRGSQVVNADDSVGVSNHDIYNASPLMSPMSTMGVEITDEEAQRILWPDEPLKPSSHITEPTEKFRAGDIPLVEGKTRLMDNEKHLRDEKDEALGLAGFF